MHTIMREEQVGVTGVGDLNLHLSNECWAKARTQKLVSGDIYGIMSSSLKEKMKERQLQLIFTCKSSLYF